MEGRWLGCRLTFTTALVGYNFAADADARPFGATDLITNYLQLLSTDSLFCLA